MRIFYGKITGPSNDSGPYPLVEVDSHDNKVPAYLVQPHGMAMNPMTDSLSIVMELDGDAGKYLAFPIAQPSVRFDGLAAGQVKFGNLKHGSIIDMDDDGNIVLTAGTIKIVGNVEITGDITQTGDYDQTGVHTDSNGPHTA